MNVLISVLVVVAVLSHFYAIDVGSWFSADYTTVQNTVTVHDGYLSITSTDAIPFEILHRGSSAVATRIVGSSGSLNKSLEFGTMTNGIYSVDSSLTATGAGDMVLAANNKMRITSSTIISPDQGGGRRRRLQGGSSAQPALDVRGDVVLGQFPEDRVYIGGILRAETLNLTASTIIADGRYRSRGIENITIENLQVSNVRFDQGRLNQVFFSRFILFK